MTAGRRRPPQDTISSDILGTTKVQVAINHDVNQCKAVTNQYRCRRTVPQGAAGHYKVMLLRRLVTVIDVLRHTCCQVD